MTIGVVYWPGGLEADWGDPATGIQPCDPASQANLVGGSLLPSPEPAQQQPARTGLSCSLAHPLCASSVKT